MNEPPKTSIRCAIYTRKSTEEGLEREFNSLDAQRESAEAYIQSQKHLGWSVVSTRYDDGGFSGGTMDRPALQQLLADIESRHVDCVVVYKVDRLSRSLLDFARLMERFDQRSVSFVSVTQQFNTTNSLGRLTLNILLSFAQFEREIIGERTRDKMSAARRKGKWVGGTPVLGYDVAPGGGKLVINEKEADLVRQIFDLYRTRRSLVSLAAELKRRGCRNKSRTSARGIQHVGKEFSPSTLRLLLTNATYIGKVNYRGTIYEGEHPGILDQTVWEDVNAHLGSRRKHRGAVVRMKQNAVLAGLLYCKSCQRPMVATYSSKHGQRYRYYVCQTVRRNGWKSCPTKSVPALSIEDSVLRALRTRLVSAETRRTLQISNRDWERFLQGDTKASVAAFVEQIQYEALAHAVSIKLLHAPEAFNYEIPARRGSALPPFRDPASEALDRTPKIARMVALAHLLEARVRSGQVKDFRDLARAVGVLPERINQIVVLAQLAPQIQEYVLFLSADHAGTLTELQLRKIARDPHWGRQLAEFEQLLKLKV